MIFQLTVLLSICVLAQTACRGLCVRCVEVGSGGEATLQSVGGENVGPDDRLGARVVSTMNALWTKGSTHLLACSGFLLDDMHVVTAAHCAAEGIKEEEATIVVGKVGGQRDNLFNKENSVPNKYLALDRLLPNDRVAEKVFVHRAWFDVGAHINPFDDEHNDVEKEVLAGIPANDIKAATVGLLRLPVPYGDLAVLRLNKPLNIPLADAEEIQIGAAAVGKDTVGYGFGLNTVKNGNAYSDGSQRRVRYRVRSVNEPGRLIVGEPTAKGSYYCKGDSGGPVFVDRQFVGVFSVILGSCPESKEQLDDKVTWTSLAHYRDWIRCIVEGAEEFGGDEKCREERKNMIALNIREGR